MERLFITGQAHTFLGTACVIMGIMFLLSFIVKTDEESGIKAFRFLIGILVNICILVAAIIGINFNEPMQDYKEEFQTWQKSYLSQHVTKTTGSD